MLPRVVLASCIVAHLASPLPISAKEQQLKFDCAGKIERGDVPLDKEPDVSGAKLEIDLEKQELLLTMVHPFGAFYGKIIETTDLMMKFRAPDGTSYGAIDRTSGEFMVANMKTDTTLWLKCNLRKQLF